MGASFFFQVQEPARGEKPWIVLIHGLGMSQRSWSDPYREKLLGGALSFDYVLTDLHAPPGLRAVRQVGRLACSPPLRLSNPRPLSFWEFLKGRGLGILSWSQEKPMGAIDHAVAELQELLQETPRREKMVLLGHSRGGLIARRYLQDRRPGWDRVSGVVLLGVPNRGSRLARLPGFLRWLSFLFESNKKSPVEALPKSRERSKSLLIRLLAGYVREVGIAELAPHSDFLRSLTAGEETEKKSHIPYFNLIGTRTDFVRIYLRSSSFGRVKPIFSVFDGLERVLPPAILPMEIRQGRGDGQVSIRSAWLSWARKNFRVPANHAQLLVNSEAQIEVGRFLETL